MSSVENKEIQVMNSHLDQDIERQQFITFSVNEQEYGVDIMSVREIKGWIETTKLPNTPHYMRGVINLRGAVVPIMDLRCRFTKKNTQATKNHVVMIVNVDTRIMGILVDAVSDILTIGTNEIRPVPAMDSNDSDGVLKGLVNLEDRMVALLVLERLFDQAIDVTSKNIEQTLSDVAENVPVNETPETAKEEDALTEENSKEATKK